MISRLESAKTLRLLEQGLDCASFRHRIISNNIANVDTPGFKISGVKFEDKLRKVLNDDGIKGVRTHANHMPVGLPQYNEVIPQKIMFTDTNYRNDKNNVDIDVEMAKMSKNSIYYEACITRTNSFFTNLDEAITKGGGR
ncbi:MAG: flagellar basal body rod protein FlgB [Candidatus Muirbacterium halophilum]|nr:flagellar basal body rod protein FlgB [Candidatus Muirbacterium halophilum]MCK9475700.1 flagellar basal body rod protein FlgB [Candidatus Muirbacterium halophilum]